MQQAAARLSLIMQTDPGSAEAEIYRNLSFNLSLTLADLSAASVTVTSAMQGEGKTTTLLNLAIAAARTGKKVIVLDANLRSPAVHHAFDLSNVKGLANYLSGDCEAGDIIHPSKISGLALVNAGNSAYNASELLSSERMGLLIEELKHHYELILIDTPPILQLTDAKMMAASSDGVLLVVEHGKLRRPIARKIQEDLTNMRANLLGLVYNKMNRKEAETYLI